MTEVSEALAAFLKAQGQSLTQPRQMVFMALQNNQPLTMSELTRACPQVDRASVYRTVRLFEKLGIIQRLPIGWKYKLELSDAFQQHHHHLTCLKCGRVIPFDESPTLQQQLQVIANNKKFLMQGHQLEIQGLCHDCLEAN